MTLEFIFLKNICVKIKCILTNKEINSLNNCILLNLHRINEYGVSIEILDECKHYLFTLWEKYKFPWASTLS